MCPLWPLHIVIFYLLTLCPLWVLCQYAPRLTKNYVPLAEFDPKEVELHMDTSMDVNLHVSGLQDLQNMAPGDRHYLQLYTEQGRDNIAEPEERTIYLNSSHFNEEGFRGHFHLHGNFIGRANIGVRVKNDRSEVDIDVDGTVPVIVTRRVRVIDNVFTTSVATLVAIIYINFGCAVDWPTVKGVLKRPVGPAIGFVGQFLFMPMITYVLGLIIFPNDYEMRLGMFFTGVSPAGGASNIWTYILGGNLNLSIAMTAISTICAFGMMPLWLFTLGRQLFHLSDIKVPYDRIASFVAALVIPLAIGLLIQKFLPRISAFLVRILKGFSTLLLLFIIIFAIVTNLYLFQLFSWQIIVAGMGVPWLGYSMGYLAAKIFHQNSADSLAIALETGIQNTGIAIFLLRFSLEQPEADLTTVVPVSVAIMTPFPLMAMFIYQKLRDRFLRPQHKKIRDEETPALPHSGTTETIMPTSEDNKY